MFKGCFYGVTGWENTHGVTGWENTQVKKSAVIKNNLLRTTTEKKTQKEQPHIRLSSTVQIFEFAQNLLSSKERGDHRKGSEKIKSFEKKKFWYVRGGSFADR